MKELTCIICPRGCRLKIDDNMNVTGNFCMRGAIYAKQELTDPRRSITSIMRVSNRENLMVSVKTNKDISKAKIFEVLKAIENISVQAPIHIGDVLLKNAADSGADIIATKEVE